MDKDKLFSLLPTEVISEEDVTKRIEEQLGIIKAGIRFVSQLSINRYLNKKLADFDIDEILDLFEDLTHSDFIINENKLHFSEIDIESFAMILEENFNLESMYDLDNFYIENLLNGIDITNKDVTFIDEKIKFADVLVSFVFQSSRMSMGDAPILSMMLTVKKALLGSYLAEQNVQNLLSGQKEIYDVSILM
jgi:hypothetical protein